MEASVWLGWQANFLLARLAFLDAIVAGYESLGVETQSINEVDDGSNHDIRLYQWYFQGQKGLPHIKTIFMRKKRQVMVVGGSLLRGTESPLCWISPPLCKISCLSWVWVKDITRKLSSLVRPLDYYLLLLFCVAMKP